MDLTKLNKDRKRKPDTNLMVYGKVPPQAKELEECVLGTIMLQADAFDIAAEIIKPECFYVEAHQHVFAAFVRLSQRGVRCDLPSTVEELRKRESLELVGGPYAITKLTDKTSPNIEDNCRIILQKYVLRELIRISGETMGQAYEDSADCFDVLDEHEGKLVEVTNGFIKGNYQTTETLAKKVRDHVDYLRNHKDELSGVPTGFKLLDRITNGWQAPDLIILAARPSVGKTSFALHLARKAANHTAKPVPVAFFSLEMSASQLTQRIVSAESCVPLNRIQKPKLMDDRDYEQFLIATHRFEDMPVFIDDTAALNIFEFRAKSRRMVSKHGVGLIIVDYLQLMSGIGDRRNQNREQEVSNISRNLKATAKELNVPIIALSQLSRAVETRKENPEPQLSDLRESGAIEQDADIVMFLSRTDYQMQSDEVDPTLRGQTILKIAKNRSGDLDKLPFKTDLSIQTWYDPDFIPVPGNFKPVTHWQERERDDITF